MNERRNRPGGPILLLASQVYGSHGGVQAYTRLLAGILSSYPAAGGGRIDCVSLEDTGQEPEQHASPNSFGTFLGAGGSKARFVADAFRLAAARRSRLAVVCHTGLLPAAWMLRAAGLIGGYCLILHGIEAWRRLPAAGRLAARGASWVVATTRYTASLFGKCNGIPDERFEIAPLALAEDEVDPPPAFSPDAGLHVLTVGRLAASERYKGMDTLIQAIGGMRTSGVPATLTVVGTGDDLERLRTLARETGAEPAVEFAGGVSDQRLKELYATCDVFAMPSQREGFGIVFLEAMRHAKPCIGARSGGVPEVVRDGEEGYLIDYGNVEQLRARLLELYRYPDLRRRLGANGYLKVKAQYLFPHMRERWFAMLDARMGPSQNSLRSGAACPAGGATV